MIVFIIAFFIFGVADTFSKYKLYFIEKEEMISLSGEETASLLALKGISSKNDIFATNKHAIPERNHPGASYLYAAVLERPPLLEGYRYGEYINPKFPLIKFHNDTIFHSTDERLVKKLCLKYNISFILVEPSEKMALEDNLPEWLVKKELPGSIRIYKTNL